MSVMTRERHQSISDDLRESVDLRSRLAAMTERLDMFVVELQAQLDRDDEEERGE